jgi:hypothetical protein
MIARHAASPTNLTVLLAQTRNPSQKIARAERRTPSLGAVSALQASMGSVIDTIELYERNMIDESAASSCTGATGR